jgi:SAM-dependent methyltransferase
MDLLICPVCEESLQISLDHSICKKGHQFPVIEGILDLLPDVKDSNLLDEVQHWNDVAAKGKMKLVPDKYIGNRIIEDYRKLFKRCIEVAWKGNLPSRISMADIGCGEGSAMRYLGMLQFGNVDYIGIDLSVKSMKLCLTGSYHIPKNWNVRFIKGSAETGIFKENSLDIVFSASALHHLNLFSVMKWIGKSLKPNGILILHEPSSKNPFAKVGRKFIHDFHTKGEKPIEPSSIRQLSHEHNLSLVYEKGLHFLTGSIQYLVGKVRAPFPLVFCIYHLSRYIDSIILSPSFNYSFIQAYIKKVDDFQFQSDDSYLKA